MDNLASTQYGLALHTSSSELGLAISNFAADTRYQIWDLGRDLSLQLHPLLNEFIQPQKWKNLAFLAVAKGPGSFTGTRIGVVTARTLAQQLNLPLFAISTLAAVAWSECHQEQQEAIAVQMPAQRNQIFGAIYEHSWDPHTQRSFLKTPLPDTVMNPQEWEKILATWPNPYRRIEVTRGLGASVISLLELADLDWQRGQRPNWAEALPFYGQHPVDL